MAEVTSPLGAFDSGLSTPGHPGPERSMRWLFIVSLSALPAIALAIGVDGGRIENSAGAVRALLEWTAFGVALFTAVLCFLNFSITGNAIAPVIGVAVIAGGVMDAFAGLTASGIILPAAPPVSVMDFTWSLGRCFQASVMILGLGLLLVRGPRGRIRDRRLVGGVAVVFGLAAVAVLSYCATTPKLPMTFFPTQWVARPFDAASLALFGIAMAILYPALKARHSDAFTEAVWLSAIPAIAMQIHVAFGTAAGFDSQFAAAHVLKILAYAIPGIGLLRSYIITYHNEETARLELQDREEFLRLFRFTIDHAADCALWLSEDGRVMYANEAACRVLERTKSEICTLHISQIDPSFNPTLWREHWREVKRDCALTCESHHHSASGREFPVEITYNFVDFEQSESICALFRDISIRKRVEAAVRESELRLRSIVRTAAEGIVTIDEMGTIDTVNPAAERVFGYPVRELVGQNFEILIPSIEGSTERWKELASAGPDRIDGLRDIEGHRADGSTVPLDVSLNAMDIDGRCFYTAIIRDITEAKTTALKLAAHSDELARSNADLEQFAYVASHDLQEPLRMVASFLKLIEQKYNDVLDADGREYIRFAVDGAARMQCLIRDLLSFSQIGSKGLELEPIDCAEVVQIALANLSIAIEESGASVVVEPLPVVMGDPGQLAGLFQNLISNALKFRKPDAPMSIYVGCTTPSGQFTQQGSQIEVVVRDTGIGIAPGDHERIFAIFQRLHTRSEFDGTGIGLSICRRIVERHGGKIWVESEPGTGTEFHFTLTAGAAEKPEGDQP